jgi:hypothetical protein
MLGETKILPWVRGLQEERRRHMRASQPWLRVETEGFVYIVRDWSAGGTAIDHFHYTGHIGSLVSGKVGWSEAEALTPFRADIVRRGPDGSTVLRWLDIDAPLLAELDHVARHR